MLLLLLLVFLENYKANFSSENENKMFNLNQGISVKLFIVPVLILFQEDLEFQIPFYTELFNELGKTSSIFGNRVKFCSSSKPIFSVSVGALASILAQNIHLSTQLLTYAQLASNFLFSRCYQYMMIEAIENR